MKISHRDITAAETDNDFFKNHSEDPESGNPQQKRVPHNKIQKKYLLTMDPARKETTEQFLPLNARNQKQNKVVAPMANRSQGESDVKSL
jgi:hypothetical protein